MAQEAAEVLSQVNAMLDDDAVEAEVRDCLLEMRELLHYVKLTGRFPDSFQEEPSKQRTLGCDSWPR